MAAWRTRLRWLSAVLGGLALLVAAAVAWGWWQLRGSLPPLDGERTVAGLTAPVKIERDAASVPTLTGATRRDVARATGYLHAQDRFFQMDLLRRRGAGELSELFGTVAVDLDKSARLHGFRRTATQVVASAGSAERAVLTAYTEGVNAGLAALGNVPWEYLVLRTAPQPWREEDSVLCIYAMWFDLQDSRGSFELNRDALRVTLGSATMDFLAPRGNSWDAALDGSTFAPAPPPALRFEAPAADPAAGFAALEPAGKEVVGSNAFALSGAHTATGAALVANDMHLNLGVPHVWYRAVFQWTDATAPRRVVGVTLPGLPFMVVGSNGHVAWGFTDAYVDTSDVITIATEITANSFYKTPDGWKEIEERKEEIRVKGEKPVPFTARWTRWGPVIDGPKDGHGLVLRWSAHDAEATNLHFLDMETALTTAEGLAVAHHASFPNENIIIGDTAGDIAWTILGRVPRRVGYDGRVPVSWGYGDRRWDGYLKPEEIPVITNPAEGALWTANNRAVGGEAYAKLGDSGYDDGARGGQIRDDLRALLASGRKAVPADLLAIQLDDRALFLDRWQKFLLAVLDDQAVAQNPSRAALRDAVRTWSGRADTGSVAYRVVRSFRLHVAERTFAPFAEQAQREYPAFSWHGFRYEDALWLLVHARPAKLLTPAQPSWAALLLAAADDVTADVAKTGGSLAHFTWGARNTLAMQHPFGRFLPAAVARLLDMPAVQLPGDSDMPRVLGPRFGQSERLVVSPGHEAEGIFEMPGGQSGHPLSPYYRAGHEAWVQGAATPLLPGPAQHTLTLKPQ
ncbi:penicillin acylase family protein [Opitutus sp. GAS368]|jgi:penicillin amidase|uniref:penicillin acylase family protein n=1 Tax=Opitutus sp. GAS368 TaxID=1882749 RepID=UPI00087A7394|nr:penicillin acylase family protein [Opitutus sp. GAS368]SDR93912.1 penicillin amidase [Opitutus sp. GAS368]